MRFSPLTVTSQAFDSGNFEMEKAKLKREIAMAQAKQSKTQSAPAKSDAASGTS